MDDTSTPGEPVAGTTDPVPPDSVSEPPDAESVAESADEPSLLDGDMDGREDEVSDDPSREGRKLT